MLKTMLYVALGGALGATARYVLGILVLQAGGGQFPWGTLIVNVTGSMVLGVLAAVLAFSWAPSPELKSFLLIGVLGGFTTFSAFSFEFVLLMEKGRLDLAGLYMIGTVALSVGGLLAGLKLTRALLA